MSEHARPDLFARQWPTSPRLSPLLSPRCHRRRIPRSCQRRAAGMRARAVNFSFLPTPSTPRAHLDEGAPRQHQRALQPPPRHHPVRPGHLQAAPPPPHTPTHTTGVKLELASNPSQPPQPNRSTQSPLRQHASPLRSPLRSVTTTLSHPFDQSPLRSVTPSPTRAASQPPPPPARALRRHGRHGAPAPPPAPPSRRAEGT